MRRTEIVHENARLRLGVCDGLVVGAWYAAPEVVDVRAMLRASTAVAARRPGGMAHVNIVVGGARVAGTPRLTDDVRGELVRILRDPRARAQGVAHSIELEGLAGAATRAFVSTVLLLARTETPHKVFGDRLSAAAWVVPFLAQGGEAWSVDEVLQAAASVTSRPAAPLVA
jgi:hypothetical protein